MVNSMFALTSCVLAFAVLSRRCGTVAAVGLAALASLNAVVLCQLTSFYVDGQVASATLLVMCAAIGWAERPHWLPATAVIGSVVYLTGLKYTGVLFAVIGLTIPLIVYVHQSQRRLAIQWTKLSLASCLVAFLLAGAHPYITNIIRVGNPFYLLFGEHAVDFVAAHPTTGCCVPPGFDRIGRIRGLALSLSSASENNFGAAPIQTKWPFSLDRHELDDFFLPDVRIGGWGPFFSAGLLLSVLTALVSWQVARPSGATVAALAGVAGSVLLLPYPWWARYAPMLAFAPIILIADGWKARSPWQISILRSVVMVALGSNALLVGWSHFAQQAVATHEVRVQVAELASIAAPVFLRVRETESVRHRLIGAGIRFKEVEALPCPAKPILYSTATYCVRSER